MNLLLNFCLRYDLKYSKKIFKVIFQTLSFLVCSILAAKNWRSKPFAAIIILTGIQGLGF